MDTTEQSIPIWQRDARIDAPQGTFIASNVSTVPRQKGRFSMVVLLVFPVDLGKHVVVPSSHVGRVVAVKSPRFECFDGIQVLLFLAL